MSNSVISTLLPVTKRSYEKLLKYGALDVPADISWRSARTLVSRGVAELDPFHRRWAGRLTLRNDAPPVAVGAREEG